VLTGVCVLHHMGKLQLMRSILGIVLLVGGILLGYFGYQKLDNNKADIKIGDLEITAKDKENTTGAYIMMGAGIVAIIAGAVTLARKG
jgi:uncharacterized membrane protein HdeD (DUF308 family)